MKSIIVGTAGHIDHGKTTLVRALTGIDTDRLEEEKRRGISIDLGFAHLKLNDALQAAFIDVPGHEKFVRNMLAGVGGIDLVMLVVAADESIKPQTREHFDICRLLRIPAGFVALTKADSVDPEIVELVALEVQEFVAGSFLEGAPILPVSGVTGEGLASIRETLIQLAAGVPARETTSNFRMPVDRSFVIQGFGTVVTGTVRSGGIGIETEVEILPSGRRARIRGVQVHGTKAKRAAAGQRAAINVAGVEVADIGRGDTLARPGAFRPTRTADCLLELLPSAAKSLKARTPVHFHAGTSEVVAEMRSLVGSAGLKAGTGGIPVRLVFQEPVVLAPGDRFIIRRFSPVVTMGGGEVVDAFPPPKMRLADLAARTRGLASATLSQRVAFLIRETPGGVSLSELAVRAGVAESAVEAAIPATAARLQQPQPWLVDTGWALGKAEEWKGKLSAFHAANPLLPGMPREDFRSRELGALPVFLFDFVLSRDSGLMSTGEFLHRSTHKLALQQDEEKALALIEGAFRDAGLAVPGVPEVLAASGVDQVRARNLMQVLLRQKRLIRVTADLTFHPDALARLREILAARKGSRFGVGEFKEWTGVSRKYAIPLLEYLDRERMSRREGDLRLVL